MITVDPRIAKNAVEWADFMYPSLINFGVVSRLMDEKDWQHWAAGLLSSGGIAASGVPNPYQFSDWRDWASRFIDVVN